MSASNACKKQNKKRALELIESALKIACGGIPKEGHFALVPVDCQVTVSPIDHVSGHIGPLLVLQSVPPVQKYLFLPEDQLGLFLQSENDVLYIL